MIEEEISVSSKNCLADYILLKGAKGKGALMSHREQESTMTLKDITFEPATKEIFIDGKRSEEEVFNIEFEKKQDFLRKIKRGQKVKDLSFRVGELGEVMIIPFAPFVREIIKKTGRELDQMLKEGQEFSFIRERSFFSLRNEREFSNSEYSLRNALDRSVNRVIILKKMWEEEQENIPPSSDAEFRMGVFRIIGISRIPQYELIDPCSIFRKNLLRTGTPIELQRDEPFYMTLYQNIPNAIQGVEVKTARTLICNYPLQKQEFEGEKTCVAFDGEQIRGSPFSVQDVKMTGQSGSFYSRAPNITRSDGIITPQFHEPWEQRLKNPRIGDIGVVSGYPEHVTLREYLKMKKPLINFQVSFSFEGEQEIPQVKIPKNYYENPLRKT